MGEEYRFLSDTPNIEFSASGGSKRIKVYSAATDEYDGSYNFCEFEVDSYPVWLDVACSNPASGGGEYAGYDSYGYVSITAYENTSESDRTTNIYFILESSNYQSTVTITQKGTGTSVDPTPTNPTNEIATYSMIYNKLNLGTTGNECPTKTLILAISSSITITNESTYGSNECVRIDDINGDAYSDYIFGNHVPEHGLYLNPAGETDEYNTFATIISYRRNDDDITKPFPIEFTVTSKPDWITNITFDDFRLQNPGTTIYEQCKLFKTTSVANTTGSTREGYIVLKLNESGRTQSIHVLQYNDDFVFYAEEYDFTFPYGNDEGMQYCTVHSYHSNGYVLTTRDCTIVVDVGMQASVKSLVAADGEILYIVSMIPIKVNDSATPVKYLIVLQQEESGKQITLNITLEGNDPSAGYEFYSGAYDFSFTYDNYHHSYSPVMSWKIQPYGDPIPRTFTVTSKPSWVEVSIDTNPTFDGMNVIYTTGVMAVANTSYYARVGEVVFTQEESGLTLTWRVKLAGNTSGEDPHSDYHFRSILTTLNFTANDTYRQLTEITSYRDQGLDIASNPLPVDFTVDYNSSWIDVEIDTTPHKDFFEPRYTTTISLTKNTSEYDRTGYIMFKQATSGKTIIWTVVQKGVTSTLDDYIFVWESTADSADKSIDIPLTGHDIYNSGYVTDRIVSKQNQNGGTVTQPQVIIDSKPTWVEIELGGDSVLPFSNISLEVGALSWDTARTGTVVFKQNGSNKTLNLIVNQKEIPE